MPRNDIYSMTLKMICWRCFCGLWKWLYEILFHHWLSLRLWNKRKWGNEPSIISALLTTPSDGCNNNLRIEHMRLLVFLLSCLVLLQTLMQDFILSFAPKAFKLPSFVDIELLCCKLRTQRWLSVSTIVYHHWFLFCLSFVWKLPSFHSHHLPCASCVQALSLRHPWRLFFSSAAADVSL